MSDPNQLQEKTAPLPNQLQEKTAPLPNQLQEKTAPLSNQCYCSAQSFSSYRRFFGVHSLHGCSGDEVCMGQTLDFSKPGVFKQEIPQHTNEKEELEFLNSRFASYMGKVHLLETKNVELEEEIRALRSRETTEITDHYRKEMTELRRKVEELSNERSGLKVERDNLVVEWAKIKLRIQEEISQREVFIADKEAATQEQKRLNTQIDTHQKEIEVRKTAHQETKTLMTELHRMEVLYKLEEEKTIANKTTIARLDAEIAEITEEKKRHLRDYQDLLNAKMKLDDQINAYRKMLDGGENRNPKILY